MKKNFMKLIVQSVIGALLCVMLVCSTVFSVVLSKRTGRIEKEIDGLQQRERSLGEYVYSQTCELPVLSVWTDDGKEIRSKDVYSTCRVSVSNAEETYCFENKVAGIRGRGNSTWEMPKKPYKLKFDSKISLFGNGKAKTWTLIANYADYSMIRNYLAYAIADALDDLKYTTSTQFVDLYLDDQYQGAYLVCEQVEVGDKRVKIAEDVDDLNTGYLLEMDYRAPSEGKRGTDWFYSEKIPFAVKSPEIEEEGPYTQEEFTAYIKNYMDTLFSELASNDYGRATQYIDVNTFADAYIVYELFKNKDVGFSSFYVYKQKDDNRLHCGPIWDFDLSAGNSAKKSDNNAKNLQAKKNNVFFKQLLSYPEFCEVVKTKLESYKVVIKNVIEEKVNYVMTNYSQSFTRNFVKWDLGTKQHYGSEEVGKLKTWEENVFFVKDWLNESLDYMVQQYCA